MGRVSSRAGVSIILAAGVIAVPFVAAAGATASPPATTAIGHQQAELKGADTVAGDDFGSSVAISGTTAVVGAAGAKGYAGRAYVLAA